MRGKRNARAEAAVTLGPGFEPLVLEPSPPADLDEAYLADDPVESRSSDGETVVEPFAEPRSSGALTWSELVEREPDLSHFAAERWLAAWPRLAPLPAGFASTRLGLHRVAAYLVSPARRQANGKIGLRYTLDGFGTPFFIDRSGDERQIRVEGVSLVDQVAGSVRSTELTTLAEAGAFLSLAPDTEWAVDYDIPEPGGLDDDLDVDAEAAAALASWFGFAQSVAEELRADPLSVDASRPQLWPEHFDPALEVGSEEKQQRASYGFSPGDESDPEPYIYVSVWYPEILDENPFWNAESFPGAKLSYGQLLEAGDQRQTALDFLIDGRSRLAELG